LFCDVADSTAIAAKLDGRRRAWCVGDRRRRPHCCDRSQELAAVAQGHNAQFFQIAVCQFREQNQVDVISTNR
jgi:hypothetical protein